MRRVDLLRRTSDGAAFEALMNLRLMYVVQRRKLQNERKHETKLGQVCFSFSFSFSFHHIMTEYLTNLMIYYSDWWEASWKRAIARVEDEHAERERTRVLKEKKAKLTALKKWFNSPENVAARPYAAHLMSTGKHSENGLNSACVLNFISNIHDWIIR